MKDLSLGTHPLRGVLLLASSVFVLACMDNTTKYLAAIYAVPLIMAVRHAVNLVLLIVVLGPRQGRRLIETRRTGLVIVRALCLVVASLFFGLALQRLPVAEGTAINFLGPLLVGLLAGPVLGEKVGALSWAALLGGFVGVLLIVRPGTGLDLVGVAFLAVTIVGSVAYNLLSRVLATTESTAAMLFFTALAGTLCFGAVLPWSFGGPTPGLLEVVLLLSLGVTGGVGHYLYTAAYRFAPASLLGPVSYLQLVWSGLLGWLIFGHLPDALTFVGMAIVAAAGVTVAVASSRRLEPPAD